MAKSKHRNGVSDKVHAFELERTYWKEESEMHHEEHNDFVHQCWKTTDFISNLLEDFFSDDGWNFGMDSAPYASLVDLFAVDRETGEERRLTDCARLSSPEGWFWCAHNETVPKKFEIKAFRHSYLPKIKRVETEETEDDPAAN